METKRKKTQPAKKITKPQASQPPLKVKVELTEGSTIKDAAEKIKLKPGELLARLEKNGLIVGLNDFVDERIAELLSRITDYDVAFLTVEEKTKRLAESRPSELIVRSPVVTIMGHVDHGKTTLLDAIRSSNLVQREYGGITQHIGAYRAKIKDRYITFIDTPGHEAFTRLRARGASATDIVILVVAADDGVMPQTREAINHAKAANVPIVVALNKIDRPEANPEKTKQQLSKEGLLVEEWGGKTICVEVSAREKKNIGELLEMVLLLGDILELKANPNVLAQGVVLEAKLDTKKGPLATLIIQQGTLFPGQAFVSGLTFGKARALFDETGKPLKNAGPAIPVEVLGFEEVPVAGDIFQVTESLDAARKIAEYRKSRIVKTPYRQETRLTLEDLFKKIGPEEVKELNLIVRADVQGSIEVLADLLPTFGTDKVRINIIHTATGPVTEADVLLASASKAIIISYNVKAPQKVLELANNEGIEIRHYKIIYELTDDLKKAVLGLLEPKIVESYLGRAEIRRIFDIPRVGPIAGCYVQDGKITRNAEARLWRQGKVIYEGRISSLKHLKDNVSEVRKGLECGISLEKFREFQPGDTIEAFVREKVAQT